MRTKHKSYIFIIMISILILAFIIYNFISYKNLKVTDHSEIEFEKLIKTHLNDSSQIDLKEVIPFKWDELYVFEPYSSKEKMYSEVGVKWVSPHVSLFGYIFNINNTGLNEDHLKKVVFLKDKEVIYEANYNRYVFDFSEDHYLEKSSLLDIKEKRLNDKYTFILKNK